MIESIFFNPWIWIVAILIGLLLLATIAGIIWGVWEGDSLGGGWLLTGVCGFFLLGLSGAYFGAMLPPYDTSYYQTYRVTGEISTLERAFSGDEGTMSQTFVLEVEGVDLLISSSDQRLRTYEVGDDVNLVCTKQFEYFVTPWYSCSVGG